MTSARPCNSHAQNELPVRTTFQSSVLECSETLFYYVFSLSGLAWLAPRSSPPSSCSLSVHTFCDPPIILSPPPRTFALALSSPQSSLLPDVHLAHSPSPPSGLCLNLTCSMKLMLTNPLSTCLVPPHLPGPTWAHLTPLTQPYFVFLSTALSPPNIQCD